MKFSLINKKADPILAYSKEKNYSDTIPTVGANWLKQYDYYIKSIVNAKYNNDIIEIYNRLGIVIYRKNINYNTFEINLIEEPDGIYILKFSSIDFIDQQIIIKQ